MLSESREDISPRSDNNEQEHRLELDLQAVEVEDVPPDGGYGWVCTACVFIINANTWGVMSSNLADFIQSYAVFLAHFLTPSSTFPGATRFELALVGGLSISQALIVPPAVAWVSRLAGGSSNVPMLIGTFLIFAALMGASYSTEIWQLFLSQGVAFGWGVGFLYVTVLAVLPQWFSTRRSTAMGIALAGAGLGGLSYNLGAGKGVETIGVAWTYRVIALCTLAMNLTASMLLRDRNKFVKPNLKIFDVSEYANVEVLLIVFWGIATELGYVVLFFSLPNYAQSIGLSTHQGSVCNAMLSLGLGVGRPFVGYVSDRFGRINTAAAMTTVCGLLCFALWIPTDSYALLAVFAFLVGTVAGTYWSSVTPVAAEVIGMKRLPSAFGMICVACVPPAVFAEAIALQLVSKSGYLSTQSFVASVYLIGGLCTWLLRSWKIADTERKAEEDGRARGAGGSWEFTLVWLRTLPRTLFANKKV